MLELQPREMAEAPVGARSLLPVDLICTVCGYGAAARRAPVLCPMCRNDAWEPAPWRPFTGWHDDAGFDD